MLVSECRRPPLRPRRCTVNREYFTALTPDVAYWLGYLAADGCIALRKRDGKVRQCVLQAASKDREHLEKFSNALGSTYKLCGPYSGVWQVAIADYDLCLSLEAHGIVPAKSQTLVPPVLPEALARHWARGVIDGDGSFNAYWRPNRAKKLNGRGRPPTLGRSVTVLSVVGSYDTCAWFRDRFGGSLRTKTNIWNWAISGVRACDVIRWCYAGTAPAVRLNRKFATAVRLGIVKEDDRVDESVESGMAFA